MTNLACVGGVYALAAHLGHFPGAYGDELEQVALFSRLSVRTSWCIRSGCLKVTPEVSLFGS